LSRNRFELAEAAYRLGQTVKMALGFIDGLRGGRGNQFHYFS
jgi:hypothetical protein